MSKENRLLYLLFGKKMIFKLILKITDTNSFLAGIIMTFFFNLLPFSWLYNEKEEIFIFIEYFAVICILEVKVFSGI